MTRLTKQTCLKGMFLFLALLICISSFATNRPLIPKSNWENSMGHSTPPDGCIEILLDNRLVINLNIGMAVPNIDDYPEFYIEYDFGGYASGTWGPITNNDLFPTEINGYDAYSTERVFIIDLNPLCTGHEPPTNADPEDFEYSFSFVTPIAGQGNAMELYPVLSYPDLFPEYLFDELEEPDYTPEYGGLKHLCCQFSHDVREENQSASDILPANKETAINVFPNPVNDYLNVEVNSEDIGDVQIELNGLDGKVIKSVQKEMNATDRHIEKMDIGDIPKGIYFCRVISGDITETRKIIKS